MLYYEIIISYVILIGLKFYCRIMGNKMRTCCVGTVLTWIYAFSKFAIRKTIPHLSHKT